MGRKAIILNKMPLVGKKILITRPRDQSVTFTNHLKKLGAEVISFPTIEIAPPVSWKKLDQALDRIHSYDWIIFTSANGVIFFWRRLEERGTPDAFPSTLKICAIGPATAREWTKRGRKVDYVPKAFVAESILGGFKKMKIRGRRILLARAKVARDVLPVGLKKLGAVVDVVETYRTVRPKGGTSRLMTLLKQEQVDVITFTSSSTVNHFAEFLKGEDLKQLLKNSVIASIGPVTSRTAKEWEMKVQIQPKEYTVPALAQSIADYFSNKEFK